MPETTKIIIPMAGLGTRLRPQTWSKPKPLLRIAGQPVLDYILEQFATLPDPQNIELIFIVGHLGDQVRSYMAETRPGIKTHFYVQEEMRGQSDAVYLARQHLHGPVVVAYADTLLETTFNFLAREQNEAVAWVKAVPDPRRFGVAVEGDNGLVERLIEKPSTMENNLAVVGFYYFQQGQALVSAIEEQFRRGITLKGEYFLADAVNIMLEKGLKMRTQQVDVWLDAGTPESVLETNRYLLEHGRATPPGQFQREGVGIIPPVYIHPSAVLEGCVIGPHVSVGAGCQVTNSILCNSILDEGVNVKDSLLQNSILGRHVVVAGHATSLNLGDSSWAVMS